MCEMYHQVARIMCDTSWLLIEIHDQIRSDQSGSKRKIRVRITYLLQNDHQPDDRIRFLKPLILGSPLNGLREVPLMAEILAYQCN